MKQHLPKDPKRQPAQAPQPGREHQMEEKPKFKAPEYKGSGKLTGKVAIITGGDSGIGRSIAVLFAREGANVVIAYLEEDKDAQKTLQLIEKEGAEGMLIAGDIGRSAFADEVIARALERFGHIDIVVNNAAVQFPKKSLTEITDEQLEQTFRTNIFGYFYLSRAALPHLKEGASIINTTSVTGYRGSAHLLDYSSTKGAIIAFTRSLALSLADKKIRVNGVAPGPVWTPLIPSSFDEKKVEKFGENVPLGRPGQPEEIAPCYVFLASDQSSYMTGQVLHPNGGEIING